MTSEERGVGTHHLGSMREGRVRTLKEGLRGRREGHSPAASGEHGRKDKSGHRKGERVIGTHVLAKTEKGPH